MSNRNDTADSALALRFQYIGNTQPEIHRLATNYRSVQEILDLASAIRDADPELAQVAARGCSGFKPVIMRVSSPKHSSSYSPEQVVMHAMVEAALHQKELLPPSHTSSVALMVARSGLSSIVQNCLAKRGISFTVQQRTSYQSLHAKQVLAYYRLIVERKDDAEVERLLNNCLAFKYIRSLKDVACKNGKPLFDVIIDTEILKLINIPPEQEEVLQQHLSIIHDFNSQSRFADVWEEISRLKGNLHDRDEEEQQRKELESVLANLKGKTVSEALEYVDRYITFVDEQRTDRQLVVTTIDHAKSQAFDTVFLLNADRLDLSTSNDKARLYVSISRARDRFFLLIDEQSEKTPGFLSRFPRALCNELTWP